jgi:phosphoribosylanthranilate isomerase
VTTKIKICGLTTVETLDAALDHGADFVGFVMVKASPRYAAPEVAKALIERARARARTVLLFADTPKAEMDDLVEALQPDLIQLHGKETVEDVLRARVDYGLPIIKAVGVSGAEDLVGLEAMEAAADHLLLDAKAPKGAAYSGGHGVAFDWSLLAGRTFDKPWFLAGGLNPGNIAEALRISHAPMADVSSGVESAPGVKDASRIAAFIEAARRS